MDEPLDRGRGLRLRRRRRRLWRRALPRRSAAGTAGTADKARAKGMQWPPLPYARVPKTREHSCAVPRQGTRPFYAQAMVFGRRLRV
jgi:hypothetical protein